MPPHYADQSPENLAALVVANAAAYGHLLAPATTSGKNFMPRVAALLDVAQISEIVGVNPPTPSSARSTPATSRHRAVGRCGQGHHGAHDGFRSGRRRGQRAIESSRRPRSGQSKLVGAN
jgi:hypothetical protein